MKAPEKYQHIASTALSIALPGMGHFLLGYWVEGFLLSLVYSIALQGFLIGVFVSPGKFASALPVSFLILLVVVWLATQALFILKVRGEEEKDFEKRSRLFRKFMIAMLKNDLEDARRQLERILEADREDVDALFHLHQLLKATGDNEGAGKMLKRCRDFDEKGKWKWELADTLPSSESEKAS